MPSAEKNSSTKKAMRTQYQKASLHTVVELGSVVEAADGLEALARPRTMEKANCMMRETMDIAAMAASP